MKFIFVGNCLVRGLSFFMQRLMPEGESHYILLNDKTDLDHSSIANEVLSCDIIFMQDLHMSKKIIENTFLKDKLDSIKMIPNIVFSGFHPDIVMIPGYRSAVGNYHSAIVISSYLNGISWVRAVRMFNAFIYESFGYFLKYEISRQFIINRASAIGCDLAEPFREWERLGVFMHTVNHPKIDVLASIAKALAVNADLIPSDIPPPTAEKDYMATQGVIWPVYPEIAKRLNVPGEMVFRRPDRVLDLESFVSESYEIYNSVPQDILAKSVGGLPNTLKQLLSS